MVLALIQCMVQEDQLESSHRVHQCKTLTMSKRFQGKLLGLGTGMAFSSEAPFLFLRFSFCM